MSTNDMPGPLGELGENLTGRAAGDYSPEMSDDYSGVAETQGPRDPDENPWARGRGGDDEDRPGTVDGEDDPDGDDAL